MPRAVVNACLIVALPAAIVSMGGDAAAYDVTDPTSNLRITLVEHGRSCRVWPAGAFDSAACVGLAPHALAGEKEELLTSMVGLSGDRPYLAMVMRIDRQGQLESDQATAEKIIGDIVRGMNNHDSLPGARAVVGAVELRRVSGVQIIGARLTKSLTDGAPPAARLMEHARLYVVVARDASYMVQFNGLGVDAASIDAVADESIATVHADPAPPFVNRYELLGRLIAEAVELLATVAAIVIAIVYVARRRKSSQAPRKTQ